MSSFGDIRSLVHQPASAATWDAIVAALEEISSPRLEAEVLPYVHRALSSWDPRHLVPPASWLDRVLAGEREPRMLLARHLSLTHTHMEGDRFVRLVRSPYLEQLVSLELLWPGLDLDQLVTLLYHRSLRNLARLSLEGMELGDGVVDVLCLTGFVQRLTSLELGRNELSDEAIVHLVDELGSSLTRLDLSSNHVGCEGFAAICNAPHSSNLKSLSLWNNHVADAGVTALVNSPWLSSLSSLDLERNALTEESARLLASWPRVAELELLAITRNAIGDESLAHIDAIRSARLSP